MIDFVQPRRDAARSGRALLPEPTDAEAAVDVLHAASGGALKSRAFWVVREMRRYGLWQTPALDHFAYVPDGRVRKRATRIGLIDLPEKADTFADMKAVSRALHAVMRLATQEQRRLRPAPQRLVRPLRALRQRPHGDVPRAALSLAARVHRVVRRRSRSGRRAHTPPARRRPLVTYGW